MIYCINKVKRFLKMLDLEQYAPRTHHVYYFEPFLKPSLIGNSFRYLVPLEFPWMSIGKNNMGGSPVVFMHRKPWKNLDEATEKLRLMPYYMHSNGFLGQICVGVDASTACSMRRISPSEAFWMTEFNRGGLGEEKFDLRNYPLWNSRFPHKRATHMTSPTAIRKHVDRTLDTYMAVIRNSQNSS